MTGATSTWTKHVSAASLAAIAIIVAAPIFATFLTGIGAPESQLMSPSGLRYLTGTFSLCILVGIGATVVGSGAAMIVSLTEFPGRRFFAIALAAPFAIPAYVAAYAYGNFLGPFGPVSAVFVNQDFSGIRSLPGAAFVLTLMTYPYVYLAIRASLAGRSGALMEAARSLGAGPGRAALKILLAAGRPALAGGLALALMETAADYGVADYFGVATLSVGIFRTWHGLGDLAGATELAIALFLFALILVLIEEAGRRGEYVENVRAHRSRARLKLNPHHAAAAIFACCLPVLFGFVVPVGVLASIFTTDFSASAMRDLGSSFSNTAMIALVGAAIATMLALMLAYAARWQNSPVAKAVLRIATLGYAIPGAVIAIGILAITAGISDLTGRAMTGGAGALLYAYVARFLTAGYNSTSGGLQQISLQMDAAAKTLGAGQTRILRQIHWPQTKGAVLAGAAIIAIDIAKELPATLLLRSFNFETLSTRIYRFASDERLADAAPAALLLIGFGLIPTMMLSFITARRDARKHMTKAGGA